MVALASGIDNCAIPIVDLLEDALSHSVLTHLWEDNQSAITVARRGFSPAMRSLQKNFRVVT